MSAEPYDVLVVGGGPAGLSAALYLARYERRTALFDAGHGRSTWHQINHNYLGFPEGIPTRTLRDLGHRQLAAYPRVTILEHKVVEMRRDGDQFLACSQAGEWRGRAVILCTGVLDHYPHFAGWEAYVGRSMHWCIACDGYEARNKRIIVIGNTNTATVDALQLTRFTKRLTMLTNSHELSIDAIHQQRLEQADIPFVHDKIDTVSGRDGQVECIITQEGRQLPADALFCEHGATPQTKLASDLCVALTPAGYVEVDREQKTCQPGVFAAGDATRVHAHQVSTAVHEGGQAASAANYYLYPPHLRDE